MSTNEHRYWQNNGVNIVVNFKARFFQICIECYKQCTDLKVTQMWCHVHVPFFQTKKRDTFHVPYFSSCRPWPPWFTISPFLEVEDTKQRNGRRAHPIFSISINKTIISWVVYHDLHGLQFYHFLRLKIQKKERDVVHVPFLQSRSTKGVFLRL